MTTHAELDVEFKAWRKRNGLTGVQQDGEVDEFLTERRQVQNAVNQWPIKHPDISIQTQPNKSLFEKYLTVHDLPATEENLERAYEHLKRTGHLVIVKVLDPNEPETRPGQWTNGVFRAWDSGGTRADKPFLMGQVDPSKEASAEKVISKRVSQMSADELARNLAESPSFRKKLDESK